MNTDKEWEARARELGFGDDALRPYDLELAIKLGREMADERAEEIARAISAYDWENVNGPMNAGGIAVNIARSTITKPKEPLELSPTTTVQAHEAAIRADEREKIAALVGRKAPTSIKKIVNLIRGGEPKTREQVLEEALRKIRDDHDMDHLAESSPHHNCVLCRVKDAARRALEWKP